MDYDGYERRPPQAAKLLSREDQQRAVTEQQYQEGKRHQLEIDFLAYFQSSPAVERYVRTHDLYNDHDKNEIVAAAAKTAAAKFANTNIETEQLAQVIRDTVAGFAQQKNQLQERQNEAPTDRQPEKSGEAAFPSRLGPTGQWLGKYAELEELSHPGAHEERDNEIARLQREESDRRQTLTSEQPGTRREETTQEHEAATTEQTDRKQERSARRVEQTERFAERWDSQLRKPDHRPVGHDGFDLDGGIER
jgi:hypothetical protein